MTGATFRPRGANYVRLRTTQGGVAYHSTFEPGAYDADRARRTLDGLRAAGYNTVRVMIDPGGTDAADPHGIGRGMGTSDPVYGPYMDNVANFAAMAAERGIYVLPSLDQFPQNDRYWGIVASTNGAGGTPNMAGRNLSYLDKGRVAAKEEYMRQFAAALLARIGPWRASVILAYQADNELYFEANQAPYDKLSGTVTPLNGLTYDMADPAQRQQSADASLVEYSRRVKRGLQAGDPEALLTIGFFTNRAVGKAGYDGFKTYCSTSCTPGVDYRVPGRPASLSIFGVADFLDIHAYPNASPWNAAADLDTVERKLFKRPTSSASSAPARASTATTSRGRPTGCATPRSRPAGSAPRAGCTGPGTRTRTSRASRCSSTSTSRAGRSTASSRRSRGRIPAAPGESRRGEPALEAGDVEPGALAAAGSHVRTGPVPGQS